MTPQQSNQKLGDIIEPMPGRLVVEVAMKDEVVGGIIVPYDIAKTIHDPKATMGTVVAIPDEEDEDDDAELSRPPQRFAIGNIVIFGKYSGTEIIWHPDRTKPKQKAIILSEKDILGRIRVTAEQPNLQVK